MGLVHGTGESRVRSRSFADARVARKRSDLVENLGSDDQSLSDLDFNGGAFRWMEWLLLLVGVTYLVWSERITLSHFPHLREHQGLPPMMANHQAPRLVE